MPTLTQLGEVVARRLADSRQSAALPDEIRGRLRAGAIPTGDIETWLSHLAAPAPFLSSAERFMNSALAAELTMLIVDEVERAQSVALTAEIPTWLCRLAALWDRLDATVITFNYDMLIEYAIEAANMPWLQGHTAGDVFRGLPAGAAGSRSVSSLLSLLKMHGSVGWWWLQDDRVGTTITRGDVAGEWGAPGQLRGPRGLDRFIIPPLATKSTYLDVGPVRELWRQARLALEGASRVTVMGYSVPPTDLATSALIALHLPKETPVAVVNLDASEVSARLTRLGANVASRFDGENAVQHFVEGHEQFLARRIAGDIRAMIDRASADDEDKVVARTLGDLRAPVLRTLSGGDDPTVLVCGHPDQDLHELEAAISVGRLKEAVDSAVNSDQAVLLRFPELPDIPVLHIADRIFARGTLSVEG
jgi:hypothetical protein